MASLNLTQDELRALESTRGRLNQLAKNIASLKADVYQSRPLPHPASLQASAFILQQNLSSLVEVLNEHNELFQRLIVYPSTNYPGRTQEAILTSLLRKKLEPDVDSAVEDAREAATDAGITSSSFAAPAPPGAAKRQRRQNQQYGYGEDDDDDEDDDEDGYKEEGSEAEDGPAEPAGLGGMWADARDWCRERVLEFIKDEASDLYTKEERAAGIENVRTGLKRSLEEEDEEEEESDEEDEDEDEDEVVMTDPGMAPVAPSSAQQPMGFPGVLVGTGAEPEALMLFAVRGDAVLPKNIELESQLRGRDGTSKRPGR